MARDDTGHTWEKLNLVTVAGKGDQWGCRTCPVKFWRRGLGWNPPPGQCKKPVFARQGNRIVRNRKD